MSPNVERPATGADRSGPPTVFSRAAEHREDTPKVGRTQHALTFTLEPDGRPITVFGRLAQTLDLLIRVGANGFTSGEASPLGWARRTSHYVHRLRAVGVQIGMTWERVGDARVGRYFLVAPVAVVGPEAST